VTLRHDGVDGTRRLPLTVDPRLRAHLDASPRTRTPLDEAATARDVVDGWLAQPAVRVPVPTERHATLFGDLLVR
jgi:hypothetical protein